MTPMQAKAAERERLAIMGIHPIALMCRSDRVIAEITPEDTLAIVTRFTDDTETLGLFIAADGDKWAACNDDCHVEEFFSKKYALQYLTGQYYRLDLLLASDRRYRHMAEVA